MTQVLNGMARAGAAAVSDSEHYMVALERASKQRDRQAAERYMVTLERASQQHDGKRLNVVWVPSSGRHNGASVSGGT